MTTKVTAGVEGKQIYILFECTDSGSAKALFVPVEASRLGQALLDLSRKLVAEPNPDPEPYLSENTEIPTPKLNPYSINPGPTNPPNTIQCSVCSKSTLNSDYIAFYNINNTWFCKEHLPKADASSFLIGESPSERKERQERK